MTINEATRNDLHNGLAEFLGADRAAVLMSMLPPTGWADVASRADVEGLGRELRAEMATTRAELRAEMATLRGELIARFEARLGGTTRALMLGMVAALTAQTGLIVTMVQS